MIRSTFGFGNALLAMPLLSLLIGVREAAPLVALVGTLVSLAMLLRGWREVQWKDLSGLLLASLLGMPLGLLLLTAMPEELVKSILGLILIGFGLYQLLGVSLPRLDAEWLVLPFGFLAGVLGSAYNTNGPPLIIYGVFRGWDRDQFRASLQGFFLISNLLIITGHGLSGLWTPRILTVFLFSLLPVLGAVYLGERVAARFSQETFKRIIYYLLVLLGLLLIL
jgi:uncharacterized membrane protein YfcA